jgi:hypothetical protein
LAATSPTWTWVLEPEYGGTGGDAASGLFKNIDALTDTALLARESIQNSWDAARTLRDTERDPSIPFSITFRFVDLLGAERERMIDALGLRSLNERRTHFDKDPLQPSILDDLNDAQKPLRLLYVEDRGSHGLFGALARKRKSHLYQAMLIIGGSKKGAGDGGSFGFGKTALQRSGWVRSVFAHSTFRAQDNDPVRSRFLGVTWWPGHDVDDVAYEGKALFGDLVKGSDGVEKAAPFVDAYSDAKAAELGFPSRDPEEVGDLGTTFMIVDPAVEPEELVRQINLWWWPALEENMFPVQVIKPDGVALVPIPADDPFVRQFLKPSRIARKIEAPKEPDTRPSDGWTSGKFGSLGLSVTPEPVGMDGGKHDGKHRVALIRGPRMVIEYKTYNARRTVISGVFIASDESNELLRQAEPASHHCWNRNPSTDVPHEAAERAEHVLSRIGRGVSSMASRLTPPPPRESKALPLFSKLMAGFMGNKSGPKPPPPPGGEPIEIRFVKSPKLEVSGTDLLKATATFSVCVGETAPGEACNVEVACPIFINEDETDTRNAKARWPASLRVVGTNTGFTKTADGNWVGVITKRDKVVFAVTSDPYSDLWSATVQPDVARLTKWSEE